jgi:hypothetical protein
VTTFALSHIRERRHKFICLNDDLSHSNASLRMKKVLHDFCIRSLSLLVASPLSLSLSLCLSVLPILNAEQLDRHETCPSSRGRLRLSCRLDTRTPYSTWTSSADCMLFCSISWFHSCITALRRPFPSLSSYYHSRLAGNFGAEFGSRASFFRSFLRSCAARMSASPSIGGDSTALLHRARTIWSHQPFHVILPINLM